MTRSVNCTSTWAVQDGRCPGAVDGTGHGRHECELVDVHDEMTQRVHSTCVCVCGSTTKRAAGDLSVARFEASQKQGNAALSLDGAGRGRISVMGVDISNAISGGTLEFEAGRGTVLRVAMPLVAAFARGEIELDEDTAGALLAIDWLSPEQAREADQLRRRDLQEALGDLGTVLREWGDLLDVVRQMNDILDEVPVSMGGRNEG